MHEKIRVCAIIVMLGMQTFNAESMQVTTLNGSVDLPQAFIDASPRLKIAEKKDTHLQCRFLFSDQTAQTVRMMIRDQAALTEAKPLENTQGSEDAINAYRGMEDIRNYLILSKRLQLSLLHTEYVKRIMYSKN